MVRWLEIRITASQSLPEGKVILEKPVTGTVKPMPEDQSKQWSSQQTRSIAVLTSRMDQPVCVAMAARAKLQEVRVSEREVTGIKG